MNQDILELKDYITSHLPEGVKGELSIAHNQIYLCIAPTDLRAMLLFLRDDLRCQFKQLIDVFGIDYLEREQRLQVNYHLLSLKYNARIIVKIQTDEATPVPSAVEIYSAANWFEREVWDMYGVMFSEHPDLRRILTDYGFEGHPQRKDFPLTGHVEVRYDNERQRVVYEPVKLTQEFRSFDYTSPWEGTNYLPKKPL
jgi:NADH-quinone oxidoreductase subunit C